jgi:hypothetical protein
VRLIRQNTMKYFSIAIPALFALLMGGCSPDATGPDGSTPTGTIDADPSSIRSYGSVMFTLSASGAPIDSVIIEYGDTQRGIFAVGGKNEFSVRIGHTYIWKGIVSATMKIYSGRKYATVTRQIPIAEDGGPMVRALSIDVAEGDSLLLPLRELIYDREGDPFRYDLSVSDPGVLVTQRDSMLIIKGIDEDFNGYARLTVGYAYRMSDSALRTGTGALTIFINPRDCIKGSVEDIMAETYAGGQDPSLVLQPPFTAGSVKIDGKNANVDLSTGLFTSAKLLTGRSHTVMWSGFANAAGESSFTMSRDYPSGDREVTLLMHSTAGTGMSLTDLRAFYREANFRLKVNGREGLYAPDYAHIQDLSDYLAASGAFIEGHTLAGFTPEQQTALSGWITQEFDGILPAEFRIPVIIGSVTDALPIVLENGSPVPARGTAVAFVERTPGVLPAPMVFTEGFRIVRAWIRLRDDGADATHGVSRGWALGSFLARRAAPAGVVTDPQFAGKSCLAVAGQGPVDHLTGADKKLLWLPLLHPAGTSLDTWWRVP